MLRLRIQGQECFRTDGACETKAQRKVENNLIKDRFNACYVMMQQLAYTGIKHDWPPDVSRRRGYHGGGIKNGAAHDLLCSIDDDLYSLVAKLENFLEKAGYQMPRYEIPEAFRKIVEEGREK